MEHTTTAAFIGDHRVRRAIMGFVAAAFTLSITAVFCIYTWPLMYANQFTKDVHIATGYLAAIQQTARSLNAGVDHGYAAISESALSATGRLPAQSVLPTMGLQHPFGGRILVDSEDNGRKFAIQYEALPSDACRALAVETLGNGLVSVSVVGGQPTMVVGRPMTVDEATAACGTNYAVIRWTFY